MNDKVSKFYNLVQFYSLPRKAYRQFALMFWLVVYED